MLRAIFTALLLGSIDVAGAQTTPAAAPASVSTSPVSVNVYDRLRTDAYDWYGAPPYTTTYPFVEQLLRTSVAQKRKRLDWLLELSSSDVFDVPITSVAASTAQGSLGLGGNYYAANQNTLPAAASFKQGFLRVHGSGPDTTFRLGRFEFFDGQETAPRNSTLAWLQTNRVAQRLIGNFGFSNAQRSFDGVDAHLGKNNWDLTAMAARATQGVFNMNANPELNVDLQYLAYTRSHFANRLLWRAFAIDFHDGRTGIAKTDNRPLAVRQADHRNIRIGTYGANLLAAIPAHHGTFDVMAWGVLQNGSWGPLEQRSGAFATEAGFRWEKAATRPWLRAGIFRSTGDDNNSDAIHNTFVQLLPTARAYARFPFYNLMNSTDTFIQLVDSPSKKLEIRTDLRGLRLTSANDLWYQGGGAYDTKTFGFAGRPSGGHNSFATVADISADFQATPALAVNLYFSHSFGKSVIAADYPTRSDANFGFLEFVYRWGIKQRPN